MARAGRGAEKGGGFDAEEVVKKERHDAYTIETRFEADYYARLERYYAKVEGVVNGFISTSPGVKDRSLLKEKLKAIYQQEFKSTDAGGAAKWELENLSVDRSSEEEGGTFLHGENQFMQTNKDKLHFDLFRMMADFPHSRISAACKYSALSWRYMWKENPRKAEIMRKINGSENQIAERPTIPYVPYLSLFARRSGEGSSILRYDAKAVKTKLILVFRNALPLFSHAMSSLERLDENYFGTHFGNIFRGLMPVRSLEKFYSNWGAVIDGKGNAATGKTDENKSEVELDALDSDESGSLNASRAEIEEEKAENVTATEIRTQLLLEIKGGTQHLAKTADAFLSHSEIARERGSRDPRHFNNFLLLPHPDEDGSLEPNGAYAKMSLSWSDILTYYKAVVLFPHVVNALRLSDFHSLGMPIFAPSEPYAYTFVYPYNMPYCGRSWTWETTNKRAPWVVRCDKIVEMLTSRIRGSFNALKRSFIAQLAIPFHPKNCFSWGQHLNNFVTPEWAELLLDPFADADAHQRRVEDVMKEMHPLEAKRREAAESANTTTTKANAKAVAKQREVESHFKEHLASYAALRNSAFDADDILHFQRQDAWWDNYSNWGERKFFYQFSEWHERSGALIHFDSIRHLYELGARVVTDGDLESVSRAMLRDHKRLKDSALEWWRDMMTLS